MTREEWLLNLTHNLEPYIKERTGLNISDYPIRVSCGFPKGSSKYIGQCWSQTASKDGTFEIFISPELDIPPRVADVLIHELIHVFNGVDNGHKKKFRSFMNKLGLEGKPTATIASPELNHFLEALISEMTPYPHAKLSYVQNKKQTTRMLKGVCPECGYTIRTSRKWIEEAGYPICPNHYAHINPDENVYLERGD